MVLGFLNFGPSHASCFLPLPDFMLGYANCLLALAYGQTWECCLSSYLATCTSKDGTTSQTVEVFNATGISVLTNVKCLYDIYIIHTGDHRESLHPQTGGHRPRAVVYEWKTRQYVHTCGLWGLSLRWHGPVWNLQLWNLKVNKKYPLL